MTKEQFVKKFALELAKVRKAKGISQQEILDETGINIARIEAMESCPGLYCYYRICQYLRVPLKMVLEIFN
jgi:transcriptional regulator with XRE-family HTH domain